jgi:sugar phosphate isomerase/epimerase
MVSGCMDKNLTVGALGVKATFFEAVELAKVGGFQGLDIDVFELENVLKTKSVEDIKSVLKKNKLKLGGWGLPVEFRKDDAAFRKDLERLPSLAAVAKSLGCLRVFTWIMPASDTLPFEEHFKLHAERLKAVAKVLGDYGCVLGLEFVGPKTSRLNRKYEFIHTMDGILELRKAMKAENVGLLLDCWHWYTSHATVDQIKKLRNSDVVYVHVNDAPLGAQVDEQLDWVRRLPGETGVINIGGFLKALKQIGYDGPVTPEPFDKSLAAMPAQEAVKKVGKSMGKIWKQATV